jgi:prevent-host-death family protein
MPITTLTSREFNQDSGKAKKAAKNGPVFITERGEPAYVIMTAEDYWRMNGPGIRLGDALGHPASAHLEFEPPRSREISTPFEFD